VGQKRDPAGKSEDEWTNSGRLDKRRTVFLECPIVLMFIAISVGGCAATRVERIKNPVRTIVAPSSRANLRLVERLRTANAADRTDAQKGLVLWLELSRITAATLLLKERGANLCAVQALLGHKSIATTARYTNVDSERLRSVVGSLRLRS
jgi:Phage integrase family